MFETHIYAQRRNRLKGLINSGIALILGNTDISMNYPANTYHFRQDSNFLYFFGLDQTNLAGVIDFDNGKEYIFGNDVDIDDIIWMGAQPSMRERAARVGVENTEPFSKLDDYLKTEIRKGRKIHFLPPYRAENKLLIQSLLGINPSVQKTYSSEELIKAIVRLRSVKGLEEIDEIEKTEKVAYNMHITSMRMAHEGVYERDIAGTIEGIALAGGGSVSFPVILSMDGQILHNHCHDKKLQNGRLLVTDAGAESAMRYATDLTRTVPVGGKFTQRQREIYEIVLRANEKAIEAIRPGVFYRDVHLLSARTIAEGLSGLGLMRGNIDEAVACGAHALFFPHGLGHMMGLDVHDMEDLGENYVGYDSEISRSSQFGLAFLRLAKRLEENYVLTVEPGVYFIPALIDLWKAERKFEQYINYPLLETYKDFGGIRIEDDILVTASGSRYLGEVVPKSVADIERTMLR